MIDQNTVATLVSLCRRDGAEMVALFGSTARQQDTEQSDIDVLVRFDRPKSLIAFTALQRQLTEAVHRSVDLVTADSLSPYFRDKVLSEMQLLYGSR